MPTNFTDDQLAKATRLKHLKSLAARVNAVTTDLQDQIDALDTGAIKSVKVKAINVKFHKHRVPGHYEWVGNSLIWIKAYTEKYYTCKYKVIVKMKKKPGTKGIWVNGKFIKGNKKTYTVKFTPYPNYFVKKPPKGLKKVTVKIRSYQSKKYYGFSPTYKKKKKVTR